MGSASSLCLSPGGALAVGIFAGMPLHAYINVSHVFTHTFIITYLYHRVLQVVRPWALPLLRA
jgi:hypothetical protein